MLECRGLWALRHQSSLPGHNFPCRRHACTARFKRRIEQVRKHRHIGVTGTSFESHFARYRPTAVTQSRGQAAVDQQSVTVLEKPTRTMIPVLAITKKAKQQQQPYWRVGVNDW